MTSGKMKVGKIITISLWVALLSSCKQEKTKVLAKNTSPDFKIEFGEVSQKSIFRNDSLSIWGRSLIKGDDNRYHIYYARWPKKLGWAWVTDSEIAHAVSDSPFGPFEFKDVALGRTNKEEWDG